MQARQQDPLTVLDPGLAGWVRRALPGQRVTAATRLGGGYRNRNTLIAAAGGQAYVLRQYGADQPAVPPGTAPADPAAARICAVEAALARRLLGVAPVPEVVAADPAGSAAGQPVLLSRHVPGVPVGVALAGSGERDQAFLGRTTGRALAAIGTISFDRGGFFTDGTLEPSALDMSASLPEFVEKCLAAGPAPDVLSPAELAGLRSLARAWAPLAARASGSRQLVHSDFNPKNLLASRAHGEWSITAVLDWEFAFSGSPLHDIGNMLRFAGERPPAFTAGFTEGFRGGGGELPPGWREESEALDLFALADLLTRPVGHRYFGRAVAAIRARLIA
jgi:aminoglycoside phosphotransferase (APT) family kinase protein